MFQALERRPLSRHNHVQDSSGRSCQLGRYVQKFNEQGFPYGISVKASDPLAYNAYGLPITIHFPHKGRTSVPVLIPSGGAHHLYFEEWE